MKLDKLQISKLTLLIFLSSYISIVLYTGTTEEVLIWSWIFTLSISFWFFLLAKKSVFGCGSFIFIFLFLFLHFLFLPI
jgi:hypothetical protein